MDKQNPISTAEYLGAFGRELTAQGIDLDSATRLVELAARRLLDSHTGEGFAVRMDYVMHPGEGARIAAGPRPRYLGTARAF